jgi:hypothetical protein
MLRFCNRRYSRLPIGGTLNADRQSAHRLLLTGGRGDKKPFGESGDWR